MHMLKLILDYRLANSYAYNGILPTGESIFEDDYVYGKDNTHRIPKTILAKKFIGNLTYEYTGTDYTFAYLYSASAHFGKRVQGYYELTTNVKRTISATWSDVLIIKVQKSLIYKRKLVNFILYKRNGSVSRTYRAISITTIKQCSAFPSAVLRSASVEALLDRSG
jgi:hypothetical protein